MNRWIALALAMSGCDGETKAVADAAVADAELHETAPFTPLLCTGGNPGEPTCPITYADVTAIASGATMSMVAVAGDTRIFLHDITLRAGANGLYVEDLRFVVRREGMSIPQLGPFPPTIDLAANEALTIEAAGLEGFDAPGVQLALQYGTTR